MDAELINPFLNATKSVIETMAFTPITVGKPSLKTTNQTWGVISGIIGMASEKLQGSMVLSFDEKSVLEIVSKMLCENYTSLTHDVVDAVGEITNMICGNAKRDLSEKGFLFDMAIPVVILGKDMEVTQLAKGPVLCVPFSTEKGKFVVEATLTKR